MGKTTLVRKVCEDERVKKHFECRAWVTVSQLMKHRKVLKTMLKQLKMEDPQQLEKKSEKKQLVTGENVDYLTSAMRDYLQQKRYLIVLDDIWTEAAWNTIKIAFPENACHSSIIVTTRHTTVASFCAMREENVYPLDPMHREESWNLFCKKTFGAEFGNGCPPDLEEISKSMLDVCGGLPLAIVAVAGMLSTKRKTLLEWQQVQRSLRTELEANKNLEPMKKILWLSYDDLPYHLKPCFLYFGIFPVDYTIKRSKITRLWIAEGFVKPVANESLDEMAGRYLNELVQRNLVQAVKVDCFGRVHRCRVHDMMYELVLQKCREQNLYSTIWSQDQSSGMDDSRLRRLVVYNGQIRSGSSSNFSHLRSLLLLGPNELPADQLPGFRYMKVLHLKKVPLPSFPLEILQLFHLTYLHLRKTSIKELPKDIWKLQNLQTLDLKRTPVSSLPKEIVRLKKLRHILVYEQIYLGVDIPGKMGCLTSLHKLGHVNITGGSDQLKELSKLSQLKRLCITKLGQNDGDALCDSIRTMSELESIYLYPGGDEELLNVESLPIASPFLRSINLRGRLDKLPESIVWCKSLEKLRLNFSGLEDDPFYILQHLPSLVELNMHNDAHNGEELRARNGGFLKLRKLQIHNFSRLRLMVIEQGAMPNLDYLEFLSCKKLEKVPIGIDHLINLKELYLGLVSEECMDKIRRNEGEDWDKVKHIPRIHQIYNEGGRYYHEEI